MDRRMKTAVFWTPRLMGLLFAVFLSLFALDVFREGENFFERLISVLTHLIPTYVVVLGLVISWRRAWVGAILFGALAIAYVVWFWGRFPLTTYLFIAGPAAVISVLFLLEWFSGARPPRKG